VRVSLDRAARWQAAGASVVVFVAEPGGPGGKVTIPADLDVRLGTAVPRRLRWMFIVGTVRLALLARHADVVVSGREVGVGLLEAAAAGRASRRPVAVTVQSRPDVAISAYVGARLRGVTRKALARADLAVCVSAGMVPTVTEIGVPAERVRTVTNGVDLDRLLAAAKQAPEVVLPPGRSVVGCGRLHRQKGFDLLVRAHAIARGAGAPAHHLVVVGEGPDRAALEDLASELDVADTVVFTGFVENPQAIISRADVFVLPSRWEGYPLALVEAVCCATPSIAATCVSGPDEVLDGGRFGALVPAEDEGALGAALLRHLQDPRPLRERAAAGAAEARVRFDPARAARAHLELLEELRGGSGWARAGRSRLVSAPLRLSSQAGGVASTDRVRAGRGPELPSPANPAERLRRPSVLAVSALIAVAATSRTVRNAFSWSNPLSDTVETSRIPTTTARSSAPSILPARASCRARLTAARMTSPATTAPESPRSRVTSRKPLCAFATGTASRLRMRAAASDSTPPPPNPQNAPNP
jgi:glycosyltransferase involved in cell wall biosynthesis